MAVFVISDLHLSTLESTNKSMEVFGRRWTDYMSRLESGWRHLVGEEDTVIVPGDISWALSLSESHSDLSFIDSLPGKKILGKGNHDFWWSTMNKHEKFFETCGIKTISFLFNNAHKVEDFIIAGTRGWFIDDDASGVPDEVDFEKVARREVMRLEMSLKEARELSNLNGGLEIICFMHFPPVWKGVVAEPIVSLLREYGVKRVYYGHIHGNYTIPPTFTHEGIEMTLVSADYLDFVPRFIEKRG